MEKIKVLHQVLDPSGAGGVSAEFRALNESTLTESYNFQSMILVDIKGGLSLSNILFYYRRIKQEKPDIVHIRGAAIDSLNAIIAARIAGACKVLTTVHGMYSDLVYYDPIRRWISKNIIENIIFRLSHGISCVCKNANDRTYFDKYRSKMLPYVYNRIPKYDIDKKSVFRNDIRKMYDISDTDIVCLFVGRMTREKGLHTLEQMFQAHNCFPSNLVFLFVGDGDYKSSFENNCKTYNAKIKFAGMQSDVQRFYMASDFFLQPSLHENHSIALLEACASGIPSIATDCGGNSETIVNGETGIIIPVDDSDMLYKAIHEMLDPLKLSNYTRNVRAFNYSKFSDEECDKSLDQVYKRIMNK